MSLPPAVGGSAAAAAAFLAATLSIPAGPAAAAASAPGGSGPWFVEAGDDAGLAAPTWCGRDEKPHILESGGAGLALFDYDGDGDLDLYVVNGWRLEGAEIADKGRNRLYRNSGGGRFEDVGASAGVDDEGWGTGVAVGDVDGDRDLDLFVSNFGADALFLNRGDGTFERSANPPGIDGWSTGAVLFDADGDRDLDLYLGAYIDCTLEQVLEAEPGLDWEGLRVMLGPFGLEGKANRYFENAGGAEFREATKAAGLEDIGLFYTFGIVAADLDGDLDLDLYTANDSNPNYVYDNEGGRFTEVGLWSGAALDEGGNAQAGMGLAAADLDDDGLLDLFVTNFYKDVSTLYRNVGSFLFEDKTKALGVGQSTYAPLSWGTVLADFDSDGRLDLFVANGHIYPQADRAPEAETRFRQANLLLRGKASGFVDASDRSGPGLEVVESSRGAAAGDVDGDGDLDLAVWNMDRPPTLLRNESDPSGAWLLLDAPAALRIAVDAGGRRRLLHRVLGGSYVSVSDDRHHVGLGAAEAVDRLEIVGTDGSRTIFHALPVKRVLRFADPQEMPARF